MDRKFSVGDECRYDGVEGVVVECLELNGYPVVVVEYDNPLSPWPVGSTKEIEQAEALAEDLMLDDGVKAETVRVWRNPQRRLIELEWETV